MIIEKVINNNVVCSRDENDAEIVIMGRGIGFRAREGSVIDEKKIEKIFRIENPVTVNQFTELLANIPFQYIQLSSEIISYAKNRLNTKLNQNIYVTLTDHISFTIERYRKGIRLNNALLWEIKKFYREEFKIGEYAVELINKNLGTRLTEDEAGFIALHIITAEFDTNLGDAVGLTQLIQDALAIVKEDFQIQLDENSLHYERFVTHMKYLAQRVFRGELLEDEDSDMLRMIISKYPQEYRCGQKIANNINKTYHVTLSEEEILYLAVHIRRVTMSVNEEQ